MELAHGHLATNTFSDATITSSRRTFDGKPALQTAAAPIARADAASHDYAHVASTPAY